MSGTSQKPVYICGDCRIDVLRRRLYVNGQPVTIKVESFPFTRYGVIDGEVTSVSRDAIADEKLGFYYSARVRVAKSTMNIDGTNVLLSPGMAVTAEVTTGTRRLIEYLLSPVMEHVKESGRER